jgi:hypothetical protein
MPAGIRIAKTINRSSRLKAESDFPIDRRYHTHDLLHTFSPEYRDIMLAPNPNKITAVSAADEEDELLPDKILQNSIDTCLTEYTRTCTISNKRNDTTLHLVVWV